VPARLKEHYRQNVVPALREQFAYGNIMEVPFIEKVTVNVGVGEAMTDPRALEASMGELGTITGQKPAIRKARRSIAGFKVRAGANVACMVTLRGDRMYEFVDRLINVAIPRIRDFRGVSPKAFDKQGNYTLGVRDQTIFPEINIDDVTTVRGMNVTFTIKNSHSADESRELLRQFGMPFREQ
jgi:large subunit ribosomal protein L5